MITRRHKCEDCFTIYVCDKCTEFSENELVREHVHLRKNKTAIERFKGGVMTSPECMQRFQCEECNARTTNSNFSNCCHYGYHQNT